MACDFCAARNGVREGAEHLLRHGRLRRAGGLPPQQRLEGGLPDPGDGHEAPVPRRLRGVGLAGYPSGSYCGHEAPAPPGLRGVAEVARRAVPPRVAPPVRTSIERAASDPCRHAIEELP